MNDEALGLVHQQQSIFYGKAFPPPVRGDQLYGDCHRIGLETCDLNNEANPQAALQEIINRPPPALIHVA
ncbi:hypothetical protein ACNKHL_22745 [Shigella flexneri]